MKTGYCPKCGETCEVSFTPYIVVKGKMRFPKKKKVFVIPHCNFCQKP